MRLAQRSLADALAARVIFATMSSEDPLAARIDKLVYKARRGALSEGEQVELDMYREGNDEQRALITQSEQIHARGRPWSDRASMDAALVRQHAQHSTGRLRRTGVALTLIGFASMFVPFGALVGSVALATGTFMLAGSIIAERASRPTKDPYDDIES